MWNCAFLCLCILVHTRELSLYHVHALCTYRVWSGMYICIIIILYWILTNFCFIEELSQASSEFKTTSKKLETKLWWKNFKVSMLIKVDTCIMIYWPQWGWYGGAGSTRLWGEKDPVLPSTAWMRPALTEGPNVCMHACHRLAALLRPGW